MQKHIADSLILPNPSLISPEGVNYIRKISKLSEGAYNTIKNFTVQYGDSEREAVDIFVPDDITQPLAVLIFIHGGYWLNGSREMMSYMASAITKIPMIFCSVGYRLLPDCHLPISLSDCQKAIAKIYEVISLYGGDKTRLVISGHSAGGHMASSLLFNQEVPIPESYIRLCAPVSSVFNIRDIPKSVRDMGFTSEEEQIRMSPLYFNNLKTSIPFLLTIGENDFENILRDNSLMLAKMQYSGCIIDSLVEKNQSHFAVTFSIIESNGKWINVIKEYTEK